MPFSCSGCAIITGVAPLNSRIRNSGISGVRPQTLMNTVDLYVGVIQFIVLLLSLSIHESAHAWTADALGDPTARYLGRVSLNPLVHADPIGTILFPLIGLFSGLMFGWAKPVPVNVSRDRKSVV